MMATGRHCLRVLLVGFCCACLSWAGPNPSNDLAVLRDEAMLPVSAARFLAMRAEQAARLLGPAEVELGVNPDAWGLDIAAMMGKHKVVGVKGNEYDFGSIVFQAEGPAGKPTGVVIDCGRADVLAELRASFSRPMSAFRGPEGDRGRLWNVLPNLRQVVGSSDGQLLATIWGFVPESDPMSVSLWSRTTGGESLGFTAPENAGCAGAFSPDGTSLLLGSARGAVAGAKRTAHVVEARTGRVLHVFSGGKGWTSAAAFSGDGSFLATGGSDGEVCVWNVEAGKRVQSRDLRQGPVISLAFCAPQPLLLVATVNAYLVYDYGDDKVMSGRELVAEEYLAVLAPHRMQVAVVQRASVAGAEGGDSGACEVKLLDALSGETLWRRGVRNVESVAFAPSSPHLVVAGAGTLSFLDLQSGRKLGEKAVAPASCTEQLTFLDDGKTLVGWTGAGVLRFWAYGELAPSD